MRNDGPRETKKRRVKGWESELAARVVRAYARAITVRVLSPR